MIILTSILVVLTSVVAANGLHSPIHVCQNYNEKPLWTWTPGSDDCERAFFCSGNVNNPVTYDGRLLSKDLLCSSRVVGLIDVTDQDSREKMPMKLIAKLGRTEGRHLDINPGQNCLPGSAALFLHLRRSPSGAPFYRFLGLYGSVSVFKHLYGLFSTHPFALSLEIPPHARPANGGAFGIPLPIRKMGGRMERSITSRFKKRRGTMGEKLKRFVLGKTLSTHVVLYQAIDVLAYNSILDLLEDIQIQFVNQDPSTYLKRIFSEKLVKQQVPQFYLGDLGLFGEIEVRCDKVTVPQIQRREAPIVISADHHQSPELKEVLDQFREYHVDVAPPPIDFSHQLYIWPQYLPPIPFLANLPPVPT